MVSLLAQPANTEMASNEDKVSRFIATGISLKEYFQPLPLRILPQKATMARIRRVFYPSSPYNTNE